MAVKSKTKRSPGMARLAKSGKAETVRKAVVADQTKARKAAADKIAAEKKSAPVNAARFGAEQIITVLATSNPRRGVAAKRFALYKSGQTVAQYCDLVKKSGDERCRPLDDIDTDIKRGHISLA